MYPITKNCSTNKDFEVNESEEIFFSSMMAKLKDAENRKIELVRLSSGTIQIWFNTYYAGSVKLQGRKHNLQVLTSLYDQTVFEGDVNVLLERQHLMISYIRKYLK